MILATWNVNSLKVRIGHVLDWLNTSKADFVCLQELKLTDEMFPLSSFDAAGYGALYLGQKTYNGVAVLYRKGSAAPAGSIIKNIPGFPDAQSRLVGDEFDTRLGRIVVLSAYFPNGAEVGCDKYTYKLQWVSALQAFLSSLLDSGKNIVLAGDFNIAPEDADCWNPKLWEGSILVSPPEREAFRKLLSLGLSDTFRLFKQDEKLFTWWDYRMLGFQKNHGMRIDHILTSPGLTKHVKSAYIDKAPRKLPKPSDHAPYCIVLE